MAMSKTLKKFRIALFILFASEVALIAAGLLLYYFNVFNLQSVPYVFYIFAGSLAGIALIDFFIMWFGLRSINIKRQRINGEIARIVGGGVQESYDFGQIGLLIVDDENTIIWSNSLFAERQIKPADMNVFDFVPKLKDLVDAPANKVIKVELNGQIYEVKYLSEPRLYIFKDVTTYEHLSDFSREQAMVLAIIQFDNLKEYTGETDESADAVARARTILTDYCRNKGVLLRRVRNDAYFAVCNYSSLKKMEADGFSVLEEIKAIDMGNENPLSLSIGIAHDFSDVGKLNEMASKALDVALSRGGDQVVVSEYEKELQYFGGKSVASETTNKVKVKSVANSLISLIKSSSDVIVMGHTIADLDAIGACLGVMAIAEWCKKSCRMVFDPKLTERKTRLAFLSAFTKEESDKMTITPEAAYQSIRPSTLLVVVDISVPNRTMAPKLLEKSSKTIVIDHHRRGEKFIEKPVLAYIEPSASSACEIMAEMIHYATANPRIELSPVYATLMLAGMFLDTNFFKSKSTGIRTFGAAEVLKEYGADNSIADDYLKDEYEEFELTNKIISTMQTAYYGVVYCVADQNDIIERAALAKVGNRVMQLKGMHAVFVVGRTSEKTIGVSARSDQTINVQLLCEKLGGGGHFSMAAAEFTNQSMDSVVSKLRVVLDNYLEDAKAGGKGIKEA